MSVAVAAIELFPTLIRDALISDPKFVKEYGISTDAVLSFGESGLKFERSILFDAVRASFDAADKSSTAKDLSGHEWRVEFHANGDPLLIALIQGERRLAVSHLALLSTDREMRLKVLRKEADRVNLPSSALEMWEVLVALRPPDNDELGDIHNDLLNTPVAVRNSIHENLISGTVALNVLVPRSEEYYERLIGSYEEGQAFEDFVTRVATPHMCSLVEWRPLEGYQLSLLLSGQPSLNAALDTLDLQAGELANIYNWLADEGDALSRAAAIVSGLGRIETSAELNEPFSRLIHAAVVSEPTSNVDPYRLLSSLIILVYGEIAYARIHASKPPYWRRLAAIAQATLVARCAVAARGDATSFIEWATTSRWQVFLLQCYVDMRLEPRWLPEFIFPDQLRNEIGGRIWFAADTHAEAVTQSGWKKILLDDADGSLRSQLKFPLSFLPGPLEGGTTSVHELPAEYLADMRSDLMKPTVVIGSFSSLLNASLLFSIPTEIAELAADAIVRSDYHLESFDDRAPLIPHLVGLATVAAVTKNHKLADALFVLLRKNRRIYPAELGVEDSFRIAMIACASRVDLSEWARCVGDYVTDMAFQQVQREEALRLLSNLVHLCHLVPELWATCGQADAALRSILNI
jgi:hypothetical protein